ncbi:MAG: hypothetical protein GMKNLPBB_02313 [Myxococcota bacterium]|nr:hypothetical protein [Myxococcota bacterium]
MSNLLTACVLSFSIFIAVPAYAQGKPATGASSTGPGLKSELWVMHVDQMPGTYQLRNTAYYLNDNVIALPAVRRNKSFQATKKIDIGTHRIPSGRHRLDVQSIYRGEHGLFTYLRDYEFHVRSTHEFEVTDGDSYEVQVVNFTQDGLMRFEKRPAIEVRLFNKRTGVTVPVKSSSTFEIVPIRKEGGVAQAAR